MNGRFCFSESQKWNYSIQVLYSRVLLFFKSGLFFTFAFFELLSGVILDGGVGQSGDWNQKQGQILIYNNIFGLITLFVIYKRNSSEDMSQISITTILICILIIILQTEYAQSRQNWRQKDYRASNYRRQKYQRYKKDYSKYTRDETIKGYHKQSPLPKKEVKQKVKSTSAKQLPQLPQAKSKKPTKIQKKVRIQMKQETKQQQKAIIDQKLMPIAEIAPQIQNQLKQIRRLIEESRQKQIEEEQKKNDQKNQQAQPVVPDVVCQEKPVYDYNLLVLTWVPEECYADIDCEKDWQTQDDLRSPTIHAFRPSGSSSYYQTCFRDRGDPSCQQNAYKMDFDIDEALWNVTGLIYQISQYWPALKFTHDEDSFYNRQWLHHGSCYLMNMIEDNPNAYKYDRAAFNRTIMIEYFRTAINKFKQLAIDVQPGIEYAQKQDLANDINFRGKQTHFMLMCNKKNEIVEITFCFNRSKLPGKQVTIPCTMDDLCDETRPLRIKKPFMI